MTCARYRWIDLHPPGAACGFSRQTFTAGRQGRLHDHDYAEVTWIEAGAGEHLINGQVVPVRSGDVVALRPHDRHCWRTDQSGFTFANVSFPLATWRWLWNRHGRRAPAAWPWQDGRLPRAYALSPRQRQLLSGMGDWLARGSGDQLDLDCFLLALLRLLRQRGSWAPAEVAPVPPWLRDALDALSGDAALAAGLPALVRAAGRSAAHVNRACRATFAQTATDLVTNLRLDRAAERLAGGDDPIADIAHSLGFAHLAWFYRAFARRFATTPRRWRAARRAVVL